MPATQTPQRPGGYNPLGYGQNRMLARGQPGLKAQTWPNLGGIAAYGSSPSTPPAYIPQATPTQLPPVAPPPPVVLNRGPAVATMAPPPQILSAQNAGTLVNPNPPANSVTPVAPSTNPMYPALFGNRRPAQQPGKMDWMRR